jgi:phosphoserine phosphatase
VQCVATLVSNPAAPALAVSALDDARALVPAAAPPEWLAPGLAADIFFTPPDGFDHRALADRLRSAVHPRPIDVVVQPAAHRRKRLLLADMDSTMIGQECIDELAAEVGLRRHVAAITDRAMRGEIEFAPSLRARVALLEGLPATVVDEIIAQRIRVTPGARTLVATMRANGAYACLVTGGFTLFTKRVGAMIGFDEYRANTLVVDRASRLTGEVAEPIFGGDDKLATLIELRERLGLAAEETLAVGDGANDIEMMQAAGLGVAYHAKPNVAAAGAARIDHGDLTALLYAQGYRDVDFVKSE